MPEKEKPSLISKLYRYEDFEDAIFSQSPDDLHGLVTDGSLSRVISRLTPSQKKALHLTAVQGYTAAEAAVLLGVSERNVRKLYTTALYHIRGKMYPIIKLKRKLETEEKYRTIASKRDICTTLEERKFLETANGRVKGYYGKMTGE